MKDVILQEDLRLIAQSGEIEWDKFRGKTILVTGATGYIGSILVKALILASEEHGLALHVLAFVRNLGKAKMVLGDVMMKPDACVCVVGDLNAAINVEGPVDYIIHTAAVTESRLMVGQPYETILTTLRGTASMIALARQKHVHGMVYLSSMEVYGTTDSRDYEMTEDKLGFVNPLLPRSSYPESKRMAEGMCASAAREYGAPIVIARLAQTFGAGVSPTDSRVFVQFARAIINENDILLKTDGSKAQCYCYSRDAIIGLLMLLTKGKKGEAYNVSNEDTFCTIRQMAERLIAAHPKSKTRLVIDIPADVSSSVYPPSSKMKVMNGKIKSLGWMPTVGLDEMYRRLIESMRSCI